MLWLVMTRLWDVVYETQSTGPRNSNGVSLRQKRHPDMFILWYCSDKYELNH